MVKLKDLINEIYAMTPLKHEEWDPAHTRDALQWTLTQNYIPLYPKQIENLFGKIPVNAFHTTSPQNIESVSKILGKKKSISTFTKANKSTGLAKGRGVQTGSGGVVFYVEGLLLGRKAEDFDTVPDRTGRRWVMGHHVFGTGSQLVRNVIKKAGLPDYGEWRDIEDEIVGEVEDDPKNDDLGWKERDALVKKKLAPIVQKHIKKYIDTTNALLKKHKDRPSCEISITACIHKTDNWPIHVDKSSIEMEEGDGVVYLGCDLPHWRNEFKGEGCAQVFMHYVDQNGPHSKHKEDILKDEQ